MLETGLKIKCMELGYLLGQTEEDIMENTKMISKSIHFLHQIYELIL